MALDIETGFKKLFSTIAQGEKGYHQDYKRVVKLANKYERLITGDEAGKLLYRFTPRENEVQFKQRVRLTQLVTPAISEKIALRDFLGSS